MRDLQLLLTPAPRRRPQSIVTDAPAHRRRHPAGGRGGRIWRYFRSAHAHRGHAGGTGGLAKRPDGFRRRIPHLGVRAGKSHLINGLYKGSAGQVTRVEGPFWPLDVTYFTSHDKSSLEFYFLHYTLNRLELPKLARGVKPGINRNDVYALRIPLPPLREQRRIVAVLNEAFEGLDRARAHVEANIIDLDELSTRYLDDRLSQLSNRVGRTSIAEIANVKGGKRLPKGVRPDPKPTSFPYITVSDMAEDGTISYGRLSYISKEVQEAISRYTISCRDVYVSIAGSIGKFGIIPDSLDGANLTENAAKLVLFHGWDMEYVYWCARSTDFGEQVAQQTRMAAQPKLALRRLGEITISDTSPRQQLDIARMMGKLCAASAVLARSYRCKLDDLNALRESLLQCAFAGELT